MCVMRPGIEVVWPTAEEMADIAAAHAAEIERRERADRYRRERDLRRLALR
jgi:hypothetical protein